MSAINAFRSREAVHVICDGLAYDREGVPVVVDLAKTHLIAGMRASVSSTGPATLAEVIAERIEGRYESFDSLTAGSTELLRELFLEHVEAHFDGDAVAQLVLSGWHEAANRPGLYCMNLRTEGDRWARVLRISYEPGAPEAPFELREHEILSLPTPTLPMFKAAGFDLLADLDGVDPGSYLLHQLEIQRRMPFDGRFIVGGHALLTSIDARGCSQRIVHSWDEDCVGETIQPSRMDWAEWRMKRSGVNVDGLSRLQRERMQKKARKGTLRVVA